MSLVLEIPSLPSAAVAGTDARFPVGRIFCVGRNYAAHAAEMGQTEREAPFFFTKFPQALVPGGGTIPYPPATSNFHYEGELVIAVGKAGAKLDPKNALDVVFGYACGLDLTRRDLQFSARDKGRPWDMGKNFANAAPLGTIRPAKQGHFERGAITLTVDGETKQEGNIADMIWSCAEILAHLSTLDRLLPGDLVYTGTPAGVAPVTPGNVIEVTVDGLEPLRVTIGERDPAFA